MPLSGGGVKQCCTTLLLTINVTASFNQLLCDGRMPNCGRDAKRRVPIVHLKIDVTASSDELLTTACALAPLVSFW